MKFVLLSVFLLAAGIAKADVTACTTDGCDIVRNTQTDALLKFLETSPQLEDRCSGINASLLSFARTSDDEFVIQCGESFDHSESITIGFDTQPDGTMVAKIK